jgi:hypothetical protein
MVLEFRPKLIQELRNNYTGILEEEKEIINSNSV